MGFLGETRRTGSGSGLYMGKRSLMCPTILWDQKKEIYKLWYCGGGWFEPDAIGYAESKDGIVWEKCGKNPVFTPDKKNLWERAHVAGCQVIQMDGWYYMVLYRL